MDLPHSSRSVPSKHLFFAATLATLLTLGGCVVYPTPEGNVIAPAPLPAVNVGIYGTPAGYNYNNYPVYVYNGRTCYYNNGRRYYYNGGGYNRNVYYNRNVTYNRYGYPRNNSYYRNKYYGGSGYNRGGYNRGYYYNR